MLMQCKGPMLMQCKGPMHADAVQGTHAMQCKGPMLMQCKGPMHADAVQGTHADAVQGTHADAVQGTHADAVQGTHADAVPARICMLHDLCMQQKRTCKIMQDCARILQELHARLACDMSLFLHDSCTILHISCKKWCKILQELLQE